MVVPGVFLTNPIREAIIAHAREEMPRECCGLLVGSPGAMTSGGAEVRLLRLPNVAPRRDRYEMAPEALVRVAHESERDGWDIVAIYHSHPTGPARPSATDIALAFWPDAVWLICGLEGAEAPLIRAFTIADEHVAEHELVVV